MISSVYIKMFPRKTRESPLALPFIRQTFDKLEAKIKESYRFCRIIFIPAHCRAAYETISRNHKLTTLVSKVTEKLKSHGIPRNTNDEVITISVNPKIVTPTL